MACSLFSTAIHSTQLTTECFYLFCIFNLNSSTVYSYMCTHRVTLCPYFCVKEKTLPSLAVIPNNAKRAHYILKSVHALSHFIGWVSISLFLCVVLLSNKLNRLSMFPSHNPLQRRPWRDINQPHSLAPCKPRPQSFIFIIS